MILDVPYQSQEPPETTEERRWCGIASLWMVIAYYLKDQAPKVEELLDKYGTDFEQGGFQHKDLLKIARDFGLSGFRKSWWAEPGVNPLLQTFREEGESEKEIQEWLETNTKEGLFTIKKYLDEGQPIIVSLSPEFHDGQSTHLVVIVGYDDQDLILHDPYKKGSNFKISEEEFKKYCIRQAIIISKRQT